jgi:hypothetical protein
LCQYQTGFKQPVLKMAYGIASRDYLERAVIRLTENSPESLFYAAFELRCGIEARMQEYLDAWDYIAKKRKSGWRIADLGRNIERAFRAGNTFVRLAVHDNQRDGLLVCFYHTPVTKKLRRQGEKLGNYLHSMKRYRADGDDWWAQLRTELRDVVEGLRIANMGTLLGPPVVRRATGKVQMNMELLPGRNVDSLLQDFMGQRHKVNVSYRPSLPDPIEPEAVLWTPPRSPVRSL